MKVAAAKGKLAPRGYVRLYLGKSPSVWKATLSSKGIATIVIDPGLTIFIGSYSISAHYVPTSSFTASESKRDALTITAPKHITTASDGLGIETLTAGKGAAAKQGESLTVLDTAYTSAGLVDGETLTQPGSHFTYTAQANPEQVIAGFDEGVIGMRLGEVRVLEVPASLNSADSQDLLFVVDLVSINK